MLISSNNFICNTCILISNAGCKVSKSFTMSNLRQKYMYRLHFSENLDLFVVWLCLVKVAETFTENLKHYVLQRNTDNFTKCMLRRTKPFLSPQRTDWLQDLWTTKGSGECVLGTKGSAESLSGYRVKLPCHVTWPNFLTKADVGQFSDNGWWVSSCTD